MLLRFLFIIIITLAGVGFFHPLKKCIYLLIARRLFPFIYICLLALVLFNIYTKGFFISLLSTFTLSLIRSFYLYVFVLISISVFLFCCLVFIHFFVFLCLYSYFLSLLTFLVFFHIGTSFIFPIYTLAFVILIRSQ